MVHALNFPKSLLWGLVLLCLPTLLPAQGFIRSIAMNPFKADIQPIPATGGYLLASRIYDGTMPTMVYMELDSFCRTQATYGLATAEELEVAKLVPLITGNFVAIGTGADSLGSHAMTYLVDAQGNPSNLLLASYDYAANWVDAVALPDGGFASTGTYGTISNGICTIVARFDNLGDTMWTRRLSFPIELLKATAIDLLPGGDLMVCGYHDDGQSNLPDLALLRFTPSGDLVWAKRYSTDFNMYPFDITLSGTKVYVATTMVDRVNFNYNMGVATFDTAGTPIWATELGGYAGAGASRVILDAVGNPLLLGYYDLPLGFNATMASLSNTGTLQWARSYDLHGDSKPLTALPLSGDRYLLLVEESTSSEPIHLIQTGPDGRVNGPCNSLTPNFTANPVAMTPVPLSPAIGSGMSLNTVLIQVSQPSIDNLLNCEPVGIAPGKALLPAQIVPHPMRNSARLVLPLDFVTEGATLQVTDLAGRTVNLTAERDADGFTLHRNGLAAGIYGYQVLQGGRLVASGKLVLE